MASTVADMAAEATPRCLSELHVQPMRDDDTPDWVGYRLVCTCGSRSGRVLGLARRCEWGGEMLLAGPLAFECAACQTRRVFFDERQHGYDAEHGYAAPDVAGSSASATCTACGGEQFLVTARASYQFEVDEVADWPTAERERVQDFFDCFSIEGVCIACDEVIDIASFECA